MQYYVSYTVVKGSKTNPFGHAYLVFSQLDTDNPEARPEVIQSVGQYGDPLEDDRWCQRMIFPARLFGPGHLREEHLRHIVLGNKYIHEHKTWRITEEEKDSILNGYAHDMGKALGGRDFKQEYSFWQTIDQLKASDNAEDKERLTQMFKSEQAATKANGGPWFNVLRRSCMTDAVCRIKSVGIDVSDMEGYLLDIPGMTSGPLDRMALQYENGKVYWTSPFTVLPRQERLTEELRTRFNHLRTFSVLAEGIKAVEQRFSIKNKSLIEANSQVDSIGKAAESLKHLTEEVAKIALYPNKITLEKNKSLEKQFKNILQSCHKELIKVDADRPLIQFVRDVMDMFNYFVHSVKSFFADQGLLLGLSPFGFAHQSMHTLKEIEKEMEVKSIPKLSAV